MLTNPVMSSYMSIFVNYLHKSMSTTLENIEDGSMGVPFLG